MSDDPSTTETSRPLVPRRWRLATVGLAATYLLGGLAHLYLGARAPAVYERFADRALLDAYRSVWMAIVVPNLDVFQPLVTLFEFGTGLALLWRGRPVRVAHGLGLGFQVSLVLSGPWGVVNALLAAAHLRCLAFSHPRNAIEALEADRSTRVE
jgi:hypothetical protein